MLVGDNTADTFGFVYGTHESNLTQKIDATGTGSDRSAEVTGLRKREHTTVKLST